MPQLTLETVADCSRHHIDRLVDLKALHLSSMAAVWSEWLAELGHGYFPIILNLLNFGYHAA
jgi:hypothetical protein